jgi:TAT-translocated FGD2 family F420-dependent dehydrogenase
MVGLVADLPPDQQAQMQVTTEGRPGGDVAPAADSPTEVGTGLRKNMIGFMLAHEQFAVPKLIEMGATASQFGFDLLATSDHLQPWQSNEGHAGAAWITMAAMAEKIGQSWMGTTVTCPTSRYNPAVVAQSFASLSQLHPGHVFLGVGSGEALNEQAATGLWPNWHERWDRLIEAIDVIQALWTGDTVSHRGRYFTVDAKLYDKPAQQIPLLAAANGKKSMALAGQHADGLITDPETWSMHASEWREAARAAGKDPSTMPVLVELFVAVDDRLWAPNAAELWRFIPKAFKRYYDLRDPAEIQRRAEAEIPLEEVTASWTVSSEPAVHAQDIERLWESGASIVNIHSGEPDQRRVLEFYGTQVLPRLKAAA